MRKEKIPILKKYKTDARNFENSRIVTLVNC